MLIALAGLPGTGKSTLGRALAEALPGLVLDKDAIRAALFPPTEIEYSARQDDFCQSIMLQVAGYLLGQDAHRYVILDGRPFASRYQRAELVAFAEAQAVSWRIVECVCSDETARRRLEHDTATRQHLARNRTYELYRALKARFEPIEQPRLVVDTDRDIGGCLEQCLAYIRADPAG